MKPSVITKGRYTYVHDVKGPAEAIDVHHIIAARRGAGVLMFCTYSLLSVVTSFLILQLIPYSPLASVLWSFILSGFLLKQFLRKHVEKGTRFDLYGRQDFPLQGKSGGVEKVLSNDASSSRGLGRFGVHSYFESVMILPAFGVQLETVYRRSVGEQFATLFQLARS